MEVEVLTNKGSDVPKAVIITGPCLPNVIVLSVKKSLLQVVTKQLVLELVMTPHLDEARQLMSLSTSNQLSRIVLLSFVFRILKEEFIPFNAPICRFCWISHGSEGRNGFV